MSDQTDASESTKASGSSKRLVILLLILGLGLAATAYDRFVARPAVQKA